MRSGKIGFALAGVIILLLFAGIPNLISYSLKRDGFVWSPINDQHGTCGDHRYYYSSVREAAENFLTYSHPSSDAVGAMYFDKSRATLYRLAAVLSLFSDDGRVGYLTSYLGSLVLSFLLLFIFACRFIEDRLFACAAALSFFFLQQPLFELLSGNLQHLVVALDRVTLNLRGDAFPDVINDSFRYLVMSTANVLIPSGMLLCFIPKTRERRYLFEVGLAFYIIAIAFSYPGLFAFLLPMIFVAHVSTFILRRKIYFDYVIAATVLVTLAWAIDLHSDLVKIYSSLPKLITESHQVDSSKGWVERIGLLAPALLSMSLLWLINNMRMHGARTENDRIFTAMIYGIAVVPLVGLIVKTELVARFFARGGWSLVCMLLLICGFAALSRSPLVKLAVIRMGVCIALIIPLVSSVRMGNAFAESGGHLIRSERWSAYEWMKKNLPKNAEVLALNYEDIQLIPVMTDLNLRVPGAEFAQDPSAAFQEYMRGLRLIGVSPEFLVRVLGGYDRGLGKMACSPSAAKGSYEDLWPVHLINQLLYLPYIKTAADISIRAESGREFTPQFKAYAESLWRTEPHSSMPRWLVFDHLLFGQYQKSAMDPRYRKIYSNEKITILEAISDGT